MPFLGPQSGSTRQLYLRDCALSSPSFSKGRIVACNLDGSNLKPVISNMSSLPDGITIDHEAGYMYWTNMGSSLSCNSGSIERANLDGSNRKIIIEQGSIGVWTPKQICLAPKSRKLYWCDREGMKVMRSNLDGSNIEVLVSTGDPPRYAEDKRNWCVGIAVDEQRGHFYWSQKGPSKGSQGRIFRGKIADPAERKVLLEHLPEPIDLEIKEDEGVLYWADRGDPPRGNTLNRAIVGRKRSVKSRFWHLRRKYRELSSSRYRTASSSTVETTSCRPETIGW